MFPPEDLDKRIQQAIKDQDPVALRFAAGELRTWLAEHPDDTRSPGFDALIEVLASIEVPPDFTPGPILSPERVLAALHKSPLSPAARPGWPFKPAVKPSGTIRSRR
jgi:hypothetical protein